VGEARLPVLVQPAIPRGWPPAPEVARPLLDTTMRSTSVMSAWGLLQYLIFLLALTALVKPAGIYLERVFGDRPPLHRFLAPVERILLRLMGVRPEEEMTWSHYASCFVVVGVVGTLLLYLLLRLQQHLVPGGPDARYLTTAMTPGLAMNTAVSFSTTTTWQAYAGETTLRYWTQLVGLVGQNFLGGACGLAVGLAFIRGFARARTSGVGNFWVDVTRALLWVFLPLSIVGSLLLVWQGVPMSFAPYAVITTLEGGRQVIPRGPVAALELIKNLGTNGGGFFNANGAHPFENPSALTNFLELLAIAALPAGLTHTFGRMTGRPRQGWVLFGVMTALFSAGLLVAGAAEESGNPRLAAAGIVGPNLEGKEARFGVAHSVLAAVATSNGATGSYAAMHDSFTPVGVSVPLVNMLLGEVAFGGLGTGLQSMLMVALIAMFIGSLMIGRTPQYLGKSVGPPEMKLVMLHTLISPLTILVLTAAAVATEAGRAGLTTNGGPHGLTEILFAYASCVGNNGQAMAGLSANNAFYEVTTAAAMIVGRFGLVVPALALAGRLAQQGRHPDTPAALPPDTLQFGILLIASALLIGALNFLPSLALGPIVEHFQLFSR